MAKTIKFNLICDGYPARTIEDLQDHFSVEDMLDYYENGLLAKWLEVRGFSRELEYVRMIRDRDPLRIIEELIQIFDVEEEESVVKEAVSDLKLKRNKESIVSSYTKGVHEASIVLENYHKKYTHLISGLVTAEDDVSVIKSHIRELVTNYHEIFKLIYRELFYMMYDNNCWLGIMLLLANEKTRDFYIPTTDELLQATSSHKYQDKKDMFNLICNWLNTKGFSKAMGDHLKTAATYTNGEWKNIEARGKNYMIIRMQTSEHIRAAGNTSEDLEYYDIANKFIILNGIDYKSTKAADVLYYMEV